MALIKIDELRPASSEFSADAEGYISELTEGELTISGGYDNGGGGGSGSGGLVGLGVGAGTTQVGLVNVNNNGDILNNSLNGNNVLGNQNNGVIGWGCGCYHPYC